MSNIYDIAPDWVSDRASYFNVSNVPRSLDYSWKFAWDHLPKRSCIQTVKQRNSYGHGDIIIGNNDVRRASHNLSLPSVTPKTEGYRLPSVTNPMGPCLTKFD